MTMKNGDMPAMPVPLNECDRFVECGVADWLTKREMMAMHMASGNMAVRNRPWSDVDPAYMARIAVEMADALLAELERTK